MWKLQIFVDYNHWMLYITKCSKHTICSIHFSLRKKTIYWFSVFFGLVDGESFVLLHSWVFVYVYKTAVTATLFHFVELWDPSQCLQPLFYEFNVKRSILPHYFCSVLIQKLFVRFSFHLSLYIFSETGLFF